MGNDGPLLTCMEVEVVGAVWIVDVVPGRLVTVNAGFSTSWEEEIVTIQTSPWIWSTSAHETKPGCIPMLNHTPIAWCQHMEQSQGSRAELLVQT